MRYAKMLVPVAFCLVAAACGGSKDAESHPADELVQGSGAPSSATVAAAQAGGNRNTGGRLTANMTGAKTARTEITDIGYCVMSMGGMDIFSLGGNNAAWSVSISGVKGMPAIGTYEIGLQGAADYMGSVSDKSTGSEPVQWQQYEATGGSVTFTKVTPESIEGTFTMQAPPQRPATTGAPLAVTGNFASPQAGACT